MQNKNDLRQILILNEINKNIDNIIFIHDNKYVLSYILCRYYVLVTDYLCFLCRLKIQLEIIGI